MVAGLLSASKKIIRWTYHFVSFCTNEQEAIYDVPIHLSINVDMKYFMQRLRHEGMSNSWCMYCQTHPNDWKGLQSVPGDVLWDISKQRQFLQDINSGQWKEPKDKKGIVSEPIIEFLGPKDYIFPQLHFKIEAVNNIIDALRAFTLLISRSQVLQARERTT